MSTQDLHEAELIRQYHLAQAASDKAFLSGDPQAEQEYQQRLEETLAELAEARGEQPAVTQAWIDSQD
jgi:hypothetical protein